VVQRYYGVSVYQLLASDHLLLAMNAICRCQTGQKSNHRPKMTLHCASAGIHVGMT